MSELGIDEAGRGSILGPLVLAGVVVCEKDITFLQDLGVMDSKQFGSSKSGKLKRKGIALEIKQKLPHKIITISSHEVDRYVEKGGLNVLEQQVALEIIQHLSSDRVVLDGKNLFGPITKQNIIAENKADLKYISVGAASILAKDSRDQQFEEICRPFNQEFGEIRGGGYANGLTLQFVQWYLKKNKNILPSFYRKSYCWKSLDLNKI